MALQVLVLAALAATVACTAHRPTPGAQPSPPSTATASPFRSGVGGRFARALCELPEPVVQRVRNGYRVGKSGEIQWVLRPPHFFQGHSHSGPWGPLQRVPLFFYGPGHVPPVGKIGGPVTLASVAPTLAGYLGYDFESADGQALPEAVIAGQDLPKLVLVVIWDAAGRNVLAEYPAEWAQIRRLIPMGAWFENAVVGTTPSMTPPVHATIGTGVYPRRHGVVDFIQREGAELTGSIGEGPHHLLEPTLADLYDRDLDNKPVIGFVGWEPTMGMLSHGSYLEGGDEDLALATKQGEWGLSLGNRDYYRFETYVEKIGGLEEEARRLDGEDGALDGSWLGGQPLATPADVEYTPAYSRYQTRVLEAVIRREGFGQDGIPDLLYTNYKQVDRVAHPWSFPTRQMSQAVAGLSGALEQLMLVLDREVGSGQWVLALTADHGATPLASETGAFVVDRRELEADILTAIDDDGDGRSAIQRILETQLWINVAELEENGHTLADVADFLMEYTPADNAADPSGVPEGLRTERLFAAAFPAEVLGRLPCTPAEAA